jgi:hypothetical protein
MKNLRQRQERKPRAGGWRRLWPNGIAGLKVPEPIAKPQQIEHISGWVYGPYTRPGAVTVISAIENCQYPDGIGGGPQYHLSISIVPSQRASDPICQAVLEHFGMVGAEEDNHEPGFHRNFWVPLDPAHRAECQCKETEDVITEANGHVWTNPKPETGEACRGCEHAHIFGGVCSIHQKASKRA